MKENIELLENMLALQNKLNGVTCGPQWINGVTTEGRFINWPRYIRMELAELIDSSPTFKHWKDINGKVDWENIRMETIDVWHFLMSEAIRVHRTEDILQACERYLVGDNIPEPSQLTYLEVIDIVDVMIESSFRSDTARVSAMAYDFFELLSAVGMSFTDLYKQYVVKNTLNTFRQDNGYKDGTYVKEINGLEDNTIIMGMITNNPTLSPEELYAKYDSFYKEKVK